MLSRYIVLCCGEGVKSLCRSCVKLVGFYPQPTTRAKYLTSQAIFVPSFHTPRVYFSQVFKQPKIANFSLLGFGLSTCSTTPTNEAIN